MRSFISIGLSSAMLLGIACSAWAEDPLTGYQQTIHDELKASLDSVEKTLANARTEIAAGDVSGATRDYNTAVRNYNTHVRRFSQLPAGNSATTALRDKAQSLADSIKQTAAAIKAGPGTKTSEKPADTTGTKAPTAFKKLDYRQEEKLKNAQFYLNEIQPKADRIIKLTSGKLDAEAIMEALDLMKTVNQRMKYAVENINALPGGHPDVAAAAKRFNGLLEQLKTAQAKIEKAAPDADKAVAARASQMDDDVAMVESWSKNLGNPQFLFDSKPEDAVVAVEQLPQMREAMGGIMKRWTARLSEKPNDKAAADMVTRLEYVDRQLSELKQYTEKLATSLPQRINADLANADKLIETGVNERRPLFFAPDSGIAQQIKFAENNAKMLKVINPVAGSSAEKSVAATRARSQAAQKALAQDIINGNKKPAEKYGGTDKEDLRQRVIAHWKEAHPNVPIIVVVFNTDGWSRTTRWDWSKGTKSFGKVDYDHIQPKLFYKLDDKHAVEIPVEVYKDYMKGEQIVVKPWEIEKEPPVTRTYLLNNLK